jgi:hypothetical protein
MPAFGNKQKGMKHIVEWSRHQGGWICLTIVWWKGKDKRGVERTNEWMGIGHNSLSLPSFLYCCWFTLGGGGGMEEEETAGARQTCRTGLNYGGKIDCANVPRLVPPKPMLKGKP